MNANSGPIRRPKTTNAAFPIRAFVALAIPIICVLTLTRAVIVAGAIKTIAVVAIAILAIATVVIVHHGAIEAQVARGTVYTVYRIYRICVSSIVYRFTCLGKDGCSVESSKFSWRPLI